jgi:hypothetical protein
MADKTAAAVFGTISTTSPGPDKNSMMQPTGQKNTGNLLGKSILTKLNMLRAQSIHTAFECCSSLDSGKYSSLH